MSVITTGRDARRSGLDVILGEAFVRAAHGLWWGYPDDLFVHAPLVILDDSGWITL